MKIRNGFVSNSSSSSFIIAAPASEKPSIKVEIDLARAVDTVISTEEELRKYISNRWCSDWEEEEDVMVLFSKSLEQINNGNSIYILNACNDGDGIEQFLYENGLDSVVLPKDTTIILGEY